MKTNELIKEFKEFDNCEYHEMSVGWVLFLPWVCKFWNGCLGGIKLGCKRGGNKGPITNLL